MQIEINWSTVAAIGAGVAAFGAACGGTIYFGVKAYRRARGLDKQEANTQTQQIIANYKALYESQQELFDAEREQMRHQITLLSTEVSELRARVRALENELNQKSGQNSNLQSLLCPFRARCPFTNTEKGPPPE